MNPVFPSILATNFFDLEERLRAFVAGGVGFIHLDVMDGHFVDQISFGPSMARAIKQRFPLAVDAHLMVSNPEKAVPHFIAAGADWISFHAEAAHDAAGLLQLIRRQGRRAGLVLNPDTPLESVLPLLAELDYVLLMSVFPGYGGQAFIPATLERLERLRREAARLAVRPLLQVDGGIHPEIAGRLRAAGADLVVVGTALYNAGDIGAQLDRFAQCLNWSRP